MPASGRRIPAAKLSRGTPGLRDSATGGFAYGAITLYGGAFQPTSATARRRYPGPRPTSPRGCPAGIWFGLSPFRSPLLRGSLLASLPAGTKMFPFPAFPPLTGRRGLFGPGRKPHSGIPGSKPACGYPGLIAACHALLRRPSRAIHRAALPCGAAVCGAEEKPFGLPTPQGEVIQPQVPLRLPCYDFTPLGSPLLVPPPKRGASQGTPSGGATGGVCFPGGLRG